MNPSCVTELNDYFPIYKTKTCVCVKYHYRLIKIYFSLKRL